MSAEEGGYFSILSLCLFVCPLGYSKSYERILIIFRRDRGGSTTK